MEMDRLQPDIKYEYGDRPGEDLDGNENFGGDEKRLSQLWRNITATVQKYRSRGFVLSAACLGLICVFSILVLQIQMKAESDMKSSQKNILQEFNETINLLQVSYSRLLTEKDQHQNDCRTDKELKLSYMNRVEKLNKTINDIQDSYSRLTTEKDQLQNDCRSDRELKLSYMNKVEKLNKTINDIQDSYRRLTTEKDQLQNDCRSDRELKLSYMNKVEKFNKTINDIQDSYRRLTTEKDQLQNDCRSDRELKLSYMNKVEEFNKTINDMQVSYSRITTEKDQLQNRFNSIEAELKKRNSEKGYSFINDKKTWTESRQFCRDRGGDLVVINSAEEQRYISSVFKEGVWIGLSDIDNEGVMKWVDNSALTKQFWGQGEPNDDRGKEDCVELIPKKPNEKNWNDIPCSEERKWICEN